jgi:prephenate dehydratase
MSELPKKIIYAGNEGSFSWAAARMIEGMDLPIEPSLSPGRVIERLHTGEASHGMIPFRNPDVGEGTILSTEEAFAKLGMPLPDANLKGEAWWEALQAMHPDWILSHRIPLPVRFHVLAKPGVKPEDITRIIAFTIASAQCGAGFERVIGRPFDLITDYSDTAKAAADLQKLLQDPSLVDRDPEAKLLLPVEHTGVLGNEWCAVMYGLDIVYRDVQNQPDGNVTTFALLRNPWHK